MYILHIVQFTCVCIDRHLHPSSRSSCNRSIVNIDVLLSKQTCYILHNGMTPPPKFTDSVPNTVDLRKLVARKVNKSEALGDMLGLEQVQVKMIKQRYSDPEQVNMEILDTWMEEQTRKPTTWRTLLKALQDMNLNKLVCEITDKLKRRLRSH